MCDSGCMGMIFVSRTVVYSPESSIISRASRTMKGLLEVGSSRIHALQNDQPVIAFSFSREVMEIKL